MPVICIYYSFASFQWFSVRLSFFLFASVLNIIAMMNPLMRSRKIEKEDGEKEDGVQLPQCVKRLLYIHWMSSFHLFAPFTHALTFWHYSFSHTFFYSQAVGTLRVPSHDWIIRTVSIASHPFAPTAKVSLFSQWCVMLCEFKREIKSERKKNSHQRGTNDLSQNGLWRNERNVMAA